MNILFIEPPASRRIGGVETALSGLTAALGAAGKTVTRRETPSNDELSSADVVHFHGLWERPHRALRRTCLNRNIPFVVSPHGMLEPWALRHKGWKKRPYLYLVERPSLRGSAAIVATSPLEARGLAAWFPASQIHTLPLGIETTVGPGYATARQTLGWQADVPVVLFLSRLHEKKGLHLLIDAWRQAAIPARLAIVGEGDPAYVTPLQAATRDVTSIEWLGPRWGAAKWPLLQGADLLCLPSHSENFGLVVLESLLVGTPVMTTPGTPWGDLGADLPVTITEPEIVSLARSLTTWAQHPHALARERTHHLVAQRFGWSGLASRYIALYQSVCARRHAC